MKKIKSSCDVNDKENVSNEYVIVEEQKKKTKKRKKVEEKEFDTTETSECEKEVCLICKENIKIKAALPCECIFCHYCINKHLKRGRFCPGCYSNGITHLDIKVNKKKFRTVQKITKKTEGNLKKVLKEHKIDVSGSKSMLRWRYDQLVCYLETQAYKERPIVNEKVAYKITKKELSIYDRKKKTGEEKEVQQKIKELIQKARKNIKPDEMNK
ncbi:hypothetical protein ECANGB1_1682 [Enterospora canceri]|uniref:RING-type domain-containing protein n=1 Tax=Enterospora canceri TaxID=1081671 RepID=A0A1Y1S9A3_9MICR|nr:hypothetical protein ECANGB1_1682 [Enterospora canceri]